MNSSGSVSSVNKQIEIYMQVIFNLKKNRPLTAIADLPEKNKQKVLDIFDKKIKRFENKIVELRLKKAQSEIQSETQS